MPWARSSSLDRHLVCPAASHLPRYSHGKWVPGYLATGDFITPDVVVDEGSRVAADWGTAMHAAKAGDATEPFATSMEPWRQKLWPDALGVHEQSVSYACSTRRVELLGEPGATLLEASAAKEGTAADCVVGSCDWWGQLPTGEPWVDDLKTGWRRPEVLTPQTLFYALCRMKLPDAADWDTCRISITHWPRGKKGAEPTRDGLWRQVPRYVIDQFELDMLGAWERATRPNPYPVSGGHCGYCESRFVCPKSNK